MNCVGGYLRAQNSFQYCSCFLKPRIDASCPSTPRPTAESHGASSCENQTRRRRIGRGRLQGNAANGGTHELGEKLVDGSVRVLGDHEQHKRRVDEAQRVVLRHLTMHADKTL